MHGHTIRREAEWVRMIQQQHGNLAELIPWDQPFELQKYSNSNREPDRSKVIGVRRTLVSWREHTWLRFGLYNWRMKETNKEETYN